METQEYEKILMAIGYNAIQSRVIALLISERAMSADEIVKKSNISRGKVYQVLKNLEEEGKLYKTKDRPANYSILDRFLDEIKDEIGKMYETVIPRLIRAKRRSEEQIIKEVCDTFQSFGYMIKDVPYIKDKIRPFADFDLTLLFDYIADGDFRFGISFVDYTKERIVENFLDDESMIPLVLTLQNLGCVNVFFIIHSDFKLANKFYNFVKSGSEEIPMSAFPPFVEKRGFPRFIGIENQGPFLVKSSENAKSKVSSILRDLRAKKSLVDQSVSKIRAEIDRIDRTIIDSEVLVRNLIRRRYPYPKIKMFEKINKFFESIREPIMKIVSREKRNLYLLKEDYMRSFVEINDRLFAWERHFYLPSVETLSEYSRILEQMALRARSINFELASLEKNLFPTEISIALRKNKALQHPERFINPFIFTVPFEPEGPFFVNQKKIEDGMKRFIENIYAGASGDFRFIVGGEGRGKTHLLENMIVPALERRHILPIYISCPLELDCVKSLLRGVLDEKNFPKDLKKEISLIIKEERYATLRDLFSLFNDVTEIAIARGYHGVVVLIDEFENALYPFLKGEIDFTMEPLATRQLNEILTASIPHLGIVVSCRSSARSILEETLKIENLDQFIMEPENLNVKEIEKIIEHKKSIWKIDQPEFSIEVIRELVVRTQGNTRNILKYCRELYRSAVLKKSKIITKRTLKSVEPLPIFID